MEHLTEAPQIRRRIVKPVRLVALVLALAALPSLAVLGFIEKAEARAAVLHVAVTFIVLMVVFRVIGKRELGQFSPFELVTLMLIPEILSNSVQGQGSLLTALSGLSMVVLLVVVVSAASQRFSAVQTLVESSPTVLVANGQLLEHNLNAERITPEELFSEMRKQGLQELSKVRFAVLEGSGSITFVPSESD